MVSHEQKKLARIDPAAVFATPEEIVRSPDLTRDERLAILRRWRYDAIELNVAADEGMPGGSSRLLDRILKAIRTIDPDADDAAHPNRRS